MYIFVGIGLYIFFTIIEFELQTRERTIRPRRIRPNWSPECQVRLIQVRLGQLRLSQVRLVQLSQVRFCQFYFFIFLGELSVGELSCNLQTSAPQNIEQLPRAIGEWQRAMCSLYGSTLINELIPTSGLLVVVIYVIHC